MALTEERVLAEVTWLVEADTMQVRWDNNILRDGARIYRVPHRVDEVKPASGTPLETEMVPGTQLFVPGRLDGSFKGRNSFPAELVVI